MNLSEWLDAEVGRQKAMAEHFGVTVSAVSQWRGNGVPVRNMRDVCSFTHGEVTLEDMVPGPSRESETTAAA